MSTYANVETFSRWLALGDILRLATITIKMIVAIPNRIHVEGSGTLTIAAVIMVPISAPCCPLLFAKMRSTCTSLW